MSERGPVLLVGCGNMGQALVRGWLTAGWTPDRLRVVDPSDAAQTAAEALGVAATASAAGVDAGFEPEIVVLAVKPRELARALPDYRKLVAAGAVVLSIAAGKPISFYEQSFGTQAAVVRGMPNTPAAIGSGMTVLVGNAGVTAEQRALCQSLMAAVGEVAWVGDEALMDAVTAVSGSGPAYVFLFIECLTEAAIATGLDRELAGQLARTTVAGAGAYALCSDLDPGELRRQVTSPGGTTEAALEVLMGEDALRSLIARAVRAATSRGRELA